MDIINQLFSLTVGVEPNKQTLQNLAGTLNSAGTADPASREHVTNAASQYYH